MAQIGRPKNENIFDGKGSEVFRILFNDWMSLKEASHVYNPKLEKSARSDKTVVNYFYRLKKDYLDSKDIIKYFERKRNGKIQHIPSKNLRYRANLNFFYNRASALGIKFKKNEKFYLQEIFEWNYLRKKIKRGQPFIEQFNEVMIKLIGFAISGWEEEVKDYEPANSNNLYARGKYYLFKKIENSADSSVKLRRFIKITKKRNPRSWINELISVMPYTLLIKIMKMYLPFTIGGEMIKKDMDKLFEFQKELYPDKELFMIKEIKKSRTKLQKARQNILELYKDYKVSQDCL